jgi:hypothetical protein
MQFLGVGDFNNDGKPDLVGSFQYDAGASVLSEHRCNRCGNDYDNLPLNAAVVFGISAGHL